MAGAVGLGLFAAVISAHVGQLSLALVMLVFCAAAAGLSARSRGQEALDAAYGVLYLGWPAVLLMKCSMAPVSSFDALRIARSSRSS